MNPIKKMLLITGLVLIIPVIAFSIFSALNIYRMFHPNLDREISGPVTLSSEWIEIVPKEPLRPERDIHEIILELTTSYEPDYKNNRIRFPDGTSGIPEVRLID
ncbi:MAG TPA: hypothetical protein VE842_06790, partial [Pyrinomonadaceae bacterium]|nr:hypothetical protein [Pyrinomonadaceae bacterium]